MGRREEFRQLADLLEDRGIPYMLVGALAMDVLGDPRSTVDVDVQVDMEPPPPGTTSWEGWFVQERSRDEVFGQETVIVHRPTKTTPFELFLTDHWFTRQALERRQTVVSERFGQKIRVPTAEDFLLLKACYWQHRSRRRSKKAQDGVDIETVFEANRETIDRAYLEGNADELGVWDALGELLGLD